MDGLYHRATPAVVIPGPLFASAAQRGRSRLPSTIQAAQRGKTLPAAASAAESCDGKRPLRGAGICSRSCLMFSALDSTPLSFKLDMFQQLRPGSQLERINVRLGCAVSAFCSASGGETEMR